MPSDKELLAEFKELSTTYENYHVMNVMLDQAVAERNNEPNPDDFWGDDQSYKEPALVPYQASTPIQKALVKCSTITVEEHNLSPYEIDITQSADRFTVRGNEMASGNRIGPSVHIYNDDGKVSADITYRNITDSYETGFNHHIPSINGLEKGTMHQLYTKGNASVKATEEGASQVINSVFNCLEKEGYQVPERVERKTSAELSKLTK